MMVIFLYFFYGKKKLIYDDDDDFSIDHPSSGNGSNRNPKPMYGYLLKKKKNEKTILIGFKYQSFWFFFQKKTNDFFLLYLNTKITNYNG